MSTICTYTEFHCRRVVRQSVKSMQIRTRLSSSQASLFMVLILLSLHKIRLSWRMMWLLWHSVDHRTKWFSHFFASVLWSFPLEQIVWLIQLANEMLKIRTDLGDTKLNVIDDRYNEIMNGNGCASRDAMDILSMAVPCRWCFADCCWEPAPLFLADATTITNDSKSHSGKGKRKKRFCFWLVFRWNSDAAIATQMSFFERWQIIKALARGSKPDLIQQKKVNNKTSKNFPLDQNNHPKFNSIQFNATELAIQTRHFSQLQIPLSL